jgi:hypothetical protein
VDDEVHKAEVALQCSADDDVGGITHHGGSAACRRQQISTSQHSRCLDAANIHGHMCT